MAPTMTSTIASMSAYFDKEQLGGRVAGQSGDVRYVKATADRDGRDDNWAASKVRDCCPLVDLVDRIGVVLQRRREVPGSR